MAWTPQHAATDIRKILGNLLAYFVANQVEALAWASPTPTLTALNIYPTAEVRMKTDFPHLGCVQRKTATEDADDGLRITYDLTFELEVATEHTEETRTAKLLQLQLDTDNYCYAFESMFLNIPQATLTANMTGVRHIYKVIASSDPLEVAISPTKSVFNVQLNAVLQFVENPY